MKTLIQEKLKRKSNLEFPNVQISQKKVKKSWSQICCYAKKNSFISTQLVHRIQTAINVKRFFKIAPKSVFHCKCSTLFCQISTKTEMRKKNYLSFLVVERAGSQYIYRLNVQIVSLKKTLHWACHCWSSLGLAQSIFQNPIGPKTVLPSIPPFHKVSHNIKQFYFKIHKQLTWKPVRLIYKQFLASQL